MLQKTIILQIQSLIYLRVLSLFAHKLLGFTISAINYVVFLEMITVRLQIKYLLQITQNNFYLSSFLCRIIMLQNDPKVSMHLCMLVSIFRFSSVNYSHPHSLILVLNLPYTTLGIYTYHPCSIPCFRQSLLHSAMTSKALFKTPRSAILVPSSCLSLSCYETQTSYGKVLKVSKLRLIREESEEN